MANRSKASSTHMDLITQSICIIRNQKVLLDVDLARLYGVETRALIQAVKRNITRFPEDFMFQLSEEEATNLRSQIVISNPDAKPKYGGRRYAPYAFTEQGVAMLSSVINSVQAIAVNIEIMRTFVRLREVFASNQELAHKFKELEHKLESHDQTIISILNVIRELMKTPDPPKKRRIGFIVSDD